MTAGRQTRSTDANNKTEVLGGGKTKKSKRGRHDEIYKTAAVLTM